MTVVECVLGELGVFFFEGEDINISPLFKERGSDLCCAALVGVLGIEFS